MEQKDATREENPAEDNSNAKNKAGPDSRSVMIYLVIFGIVGLLIVAGFIIQEIKKNKAQDDFRHCLANVKALTVAIQRYADENDGKYPENLSRLTPKYMNSIPTCPAAGRDTYSVSYKVFDDGKEYRLSCKGGNHLKITGSVLNFPQYNTKVGISRKPGDVLVFGKDPRKRTESPTPEYTEPPGTPWRLPNPC